MGSGRAYRTSFVGREDLVRELASGLGGRGSRATLVGPGGVGKTRLAHELRDALAGAMPVDGALLKIDLASARTRADVLAAASAALRLPPAAGAVETDVEVRIARAIDASRIPVCILDNCEDLDRAGSDTLARITQGVHVTPLLFTSRRPLGFPGEQVVPVPLLDRRGEDAPSAAFQLLADRAGVDVAEWWSSPADRAAVEGLLLHLDGLPLAIELAAWQLRLVAPGELAARANMLLPMLVRPPGAATPGPESERHRSLGALIEASWTALGVPERTLLTAIAELPAGASLGELEAAWRAMGHPGETVLLAVEELAVRNLVMATERVVPYETVRAYVASTRAERETEPAALAAVWAHLAAEAGRIALALSHDRAAPGVSWLIGTRLNLERALAAVDDGTGTADEAARALHLALTETFLRIGFPNDWPTRIAAFCGRGGDVDGPLAVACACSFRHVGRYEEARDWAERAVAASRPGTERARAALELSSARLRFGDVHGVLDAIDIADREAAREPGDIKDAELLWRRANVLVRSDVEGAIGLAERAIRVSAGTGNVLLEAQCEHTMAWVLFEAGRAREAMAHYGRSAALSERAQELGEAAYATVQLAAAALACGDLATALPKIEEGIASARRTGHVRAEALGLAMRGTIRHTAGAVRDAEGDYRDALRFGLLANDAWLGPFFLTTYGAASAELGDESIAELRFAEAERAIAALPEDTRMRRHGPLLVDTTRGVLDVARAKRAAAAADTKTARSSEKRARLRLDRCLASVAEHPTPELRVAAAVLTNALAALAHTSDGLTLGRDGEWFRMNAEEQVDLSKKPTLARLARVLAEAHIRGEREPIPRGQLIERVWPAERIDATAAANRLAVTLSKLRGLGLSGEIEASSRGIRLRPELVVRVEGQSS